MTLQSLMALFPYPLSVDESRIPECADAFFTGWITGIWIQPLNDIKHGCRQGFAHHCGSAGANF